LTFKFYAAYRFKIVEAFSKINGDQREFMTAQNGSLRRIDRFGRRALFASLGHSQFLQHFCDLGKIAGKTNFRAGQR